MTIAVGGSSTTWAPAIQYGPTPRRAATRRVGGCGPACFAGFQQWTPRFKQMLQIGRKQFAKKRVVICGMIKNGEKTIEKMFHLMRYTVEDALDYRLLMFENDSRDNTSHIMHVRPSSLKAQFLFCFVLCFREIADPVFCLSNALAHLTLSENLQHIRKDDLH